MTAGRVHGLVAVLLWGAVASASAQPASMPAATIDVDEARSDPVAHCYVHGVIPDDALFQLALPAAWNGSLVIFSRGFSGTELTTGAWKTTALEKGYAFAASDEGWNRLTIAREPEDTYFESRQRLRELTLLARHTVAAHYGRPSRRTLMVGGSNGGHHTKWMLESRAAAGHLLHPGMGHGGAPFDGLIASQLGALEAWIDFRESRGRRGAPAPAVLGGFSREPTR